MRMLATVIGLSVLLCGVAQAQTPPTDQADACRAEAHRQTLSGEDLVNFMHKCSAGQVTLAPATADREQACLASASILSGEDKINFMQKCEAGQISLAPATVTSQQACLASAGILSGEDKVNADRACYGK